MLASKPARSWWLMPVAAVLVVSALLAVPRLVSRQAPPAAGPELPVSLGRDSAASNDRVITSLQQRLKDNPEDYSSHINLANAYLQRVRETADPSLYTKADDLLSRAESLNPNDSALYTSRAALALARHDFAAALRDGQRAAVADPSNAAALGYVGDAQIELGRYEDAIRTYQAMVDRRPNFGSYARVAHARELYGDPEGAAEAMGMAIEAGSGVPENTAWAHVQRGNLYFLMGRLDDAASEYGVSLRALDGYALALAGQAQVSATRGDLPRAATLYERAFNRMPSPEYAILLGDVYAEMGEERKAREQYELVGAIHELQRANGVNTDMETALYLADHGVDLERSLSTARAAYEARPSIHAADALAWTLYKTGEYREAQRYATEALRLGTFDPTKLFHAGMIAKALGQEEKARQYLARALSRNPRFSVLYADQAAAALEELGGAPRAAEEGR